MLGHREISADEYIAMLRRRWWIVLIPALIVPVITYSISLRIPNRYVSQTLVLIEGQKVPDRLVTPVVTEELQQRLATMQEQILSRTRLQPIIDKFGVFKDQPIAMEEKVDRIRGQITVTPIKDESVRGMPGFYISFAADNPRMAQQVCQEITSMFMSENLKQRGERARGTTEFISNQVAEAKRHLDELDSKLAEFKKHTLGELPGDEGANMTLLTTTSAQLDAVTQMLNRAQQDKTYAEGLLAQQLTAWHAGQVSTGSGGAPSTLQSQLAAAQAQLAQAQGRGYTADHPDVVKLNHQIANLKQMIHDADAAQAKESTKDSAKEKVTATSTATESTVGSASEPISVQQLRLQLHQINQIIREKTAEQARLQRQVGMYSSRVQLSPVVEEQYKQLTRDNQAALNFYNDLLRKEKDASMATDMELRSQGEQFSVMDAPNLPEKPAYPDRKMFALGGLAGGFGLGFAISLLLEFRDKAVRTERDVEFWLELPTLATMPSATASKSIWSRLRLRRKPKARVIEQRKAAEA
jgi:polysaccharide chain length determinant protein (PEP-CTERM system associated)